MYRRALKEYPRFGEAWYRLSLTDYKLSAFSDAYKALLNTVELATRQCRCQGEAG